MKYFALVHLPLELKFINRRSETCTQTSDDVNFTTCGTLRQTVCCRALTTARNTASQTNTSNDATGNTTTTTSSAVGSSVVIVCGGYCAQ